MVKGQTATYIPSGIAPFEPSVPVEKEMFGFCTVPRSPPVCRVDYTYLQLPISKKWKNGVNKPLDIEEKVPPYGAWFAEVLLRLHGPMRKAAAHSLDRVQAAEGLERCEAAATNFTAFADPPSEINNPVFDFHPTSHPYPLLFLSTQGFTSMGHHCPSTSTNLKNGSHRPPGNNAERCHFCGGIALYWNPLFACERCGNSWHRICHNPPINPLLNNIRCWVCSICVTAESRNPIKSGARLNDTKSLRRGSRSFNEKKDMEPPSNGHGEKCVMYLDKAWNGLPWCPKQYEPPQWELGLVLRMASLTKYCLNNNIPLSMLWRPDTGVLVHAVEGGRHKYLGCNAVDAAMPEIRAARATMDGTSASVQSRGTPGSIPSLNSSSKPSRAPSTQPLNHTSPSGNSSNVSRMPVIPSKRKHVGDHERQRHAVKPERVSGSRLDINYVLNNSASPPTDLRTDTYKPREEIPDRPTPGDIEFLREKWKGDWVPPAYSSRVEPDAREVAVMKQITELLVEREKPLQLIWMRSGELGSDVMGLMIRCMNKTNTSILNYTAASAALEELQHILGREDGTRRTDQVLVRRPIPVRPNSTTSGPKFSIDSETSQLVVSQPPTQKSSPTKLTPTSTPIDITSVESASTKSNPKDSGSPCPKISSFDVAIYSQPGTTPPIGLEIPKLEPFYQEPEYLIHHGQSDPENYFCHLIGRSDEWYAEKQKEIAVRGGRKANFGKCKERLAKQLRDGFTPKPLDDFIWKHALLPETRGKPNLMDAMRMVRRMNKAVAAKADGTEQAKKEAKETPAITNDDKAEEMGVDRMETEETKTSVQINKKAKRTAPTKNKSLPKKTPATMKTKTKSKKGSSTEETDEMQNPRQKWEEVSAGRNSGPACELTPKYSDDSDLAEGFIEQQLERNSWHREHGSEENNEEEQEQEQEQEELKMTTRGMSTRSSSRRQKPAPAPAPEPLHKNLRQSRRKTRSGLKNRR
ncbi:hypothetical protein MKZ38_006016 [Zalerion maritima]|uniref:PHD-type domain-containing protein n=1 Tax=Zalerion maritima TaxID=339359 RepID=A0AAD5WPW6_9PEZI|nr:hypothetical protein MKZ38_006016 [Zalerion maritima]